MRLLHHKNNFIYAKFTAKNMTAILSSKLEFPLIGIMFLIKKRSTDAQYLISNFVIRSTEAAVL